ncbi:hypothetical protein EON82_22815, partial [bacterium]
MEERYNVPLIKIRSNSSIIDRENKHALVLWFRGYDAHSQGETAGAWVDPNASTQTTGGSGPITPPCSINSYEAYISAPEGVVSDSSTPSLHIRPADAAHGLPQMIGGYFARTQKIPSAIYGDGALSGKTVTVLTVEQTTALDPLPVGCEGSGSGFVFTKVVYQIEKYLCEDASVDSRRTFGESNSQGELTPDPNAPATELNFGSWNYKGGLFVGQVYPQYDRSGAAKVQLYPNLPANVAYRRREVQ